MKTHTSDSIEIAVMRTLCKRFRTAFGRTVASSLEAQKYLGLSLDVRSYNDAASCEFSKDLLLYSLLRKWKGWGAVIDTHAAALDAWKGAEMQCAATNHFLNTSPHSYGALAFIAKVQRKIEHVIGRWPPDDIFLRCRWSSGATADLKREHADVSEKVSRVITVTRRALPHLMKIMDDMWLQALPVVPYRIIGFNRGVMVPKNAKTDRPIAAEPTGNAFLQQGVGRFFRKSLKAFGVDLDDQSVNQDAAFWALIDGLSTLDLSNASDTLCMSTVRLLLPPAWFDLLSDLRSPKTLFDGEVYHLNKFSSMGNAFTFELESLIFWALAKVVVEEVDPNGFCTVYGDDIIVPQSCYNLLTQALHYFGFTVNADKSYKDGAFYESCGAQYHKLEDVTPAYQKEPVGNNLLELVRFHNRIYRWGKRNDMSLVKDACALILKRIATEHPRLKHVPTIPDNHPGDMGILSASCKRRRDGDYDCNTIIEVPESIGIIHPPMVKGLYAYSLRLSATKTSQKICETQGIGFNVLENGHTGRNTHTRTVLRRTRIWASSLQS